MHPHASPITHIPRSQMTGESSAMRSHHPQSVPPCPLAMPSKFHHSSSVASTNPVEDCRRRSCYRVKRQVLICVPGALPCLLVVVRPRQCPLIAPSRSILGRRPWMDGGVVGGRGKIVLVIRRSVIVVNLYRRETSRPPPLD